MNINDNSENENIIFLRRWLVGVRKAVPKLKVFKNKLGRPPSSNCHAVSTRAGGGRSRDAEKCSPAATSFARERVSPRRLLLLAHTVHSVSSP